MLTVDYLPTLTGAYFRVHGRLNELNREVLSCMLEQAVRQGTRSAILDVRRVRRLDAAGLKTLQSSFPELSLKIVGARG
jgi:hypothetical protein